MWTLWWIRYGTPYTVCTGVPQGEAFRPHLDNCRPSRMTAHVMALPRAKINLLEAGW